MGPYGIAARAAMTVLVVGLAWLAVSLVSSIAFGRWFRSLREDA
jgi:hypothetical protein